MTAVVMGVVVMIAVVVVVVVVMVVFMVVVMVGFVVMGVTVMACTVVHYFRGTGLSRQNQPRRFSRRIGGNRQADSQCREMQGNQGRANMEQGFSPSLEPERRTVKVRAE
jgi:type III secretory pathway component EscU